MKKTGDTLRGKITNISKRLGKFALSSAASAVVDIVLYTILYHYAFKSLSPALHTFWAVSIARITSSAINYACNSKFVFRITNSSALCKYYVLWFVQLCMSFVLAYFTANLLGFNPTISKLICDLALAIISFKIQERWVFKTSDKPNGPLVSVVRFFARIVTPRYQTSQSAHKDPCVYVCRHMKMHGPYTTLIWLDEQPHPMILDCFFNYGTCYRQYRDFTFPVRYNFSPLFSRILAALATVITVPIIRSLHSIPVYRGSSHSFITLKECIQVLEKGHDIIVFPDKDYANCQGSDDDIYEGFLYIESLYYRRTGKHIAFIPLVINDHERTICERAPISFASDDFNSERTIIADRIRTAIFDPNSACEQ